MEQQKSPLLVTLAVFNNGSEAYLAKNCLILNGIMCFLENESMNVLYGNALGGVVLKVSGSDYHAAHEILTAYLDAGKKKDKITQRSVNSLFVCPSCGQLNDNNQSLNRKIGFWEQCLLLFGLKKQKVICDYCFADFEKSELVK